MANVVPTETGSQVSVTHGDGIRQICSALVSWGSNTIATRYPTRSENEQPN